MANETNTTMLPVNRTPLNLSDMYYKTEDPDSRAGLELTAVMLNISGKHNRKLKEACRTLREYAIYTDKVREYAEEMDLADAVERAIRECIAEGVLKDFLEKHRAEAKEMSIFEYDQEKHMRQEREEAYNDGVETTLITQIRKKLAKGKSTEVIADELEETKERVLELIAKIRQEDASTSKNSFILPCNATPVNQIRKSGAHPAPVRCLFTQTRRTPSRQTHRKPALPVFFRKHGLFFILRFSRLAPVMGALRLSDICAAAQAS